jgi:hypothetical protein
MDSSTIITDAFNALHPVVQRVLTSADLEQKLQKLSKKHQLHLDKWTLLENEITMTLLGITDPETLINNIQTHVGVSSDEAHAIANDAAVEIFNPIRDELEANLTLEHSSAVNIPINQKMAMEAAGESVPKSVEELAPKTVSSIITARMKEMEDSKNAPTTIVADTLPNNPAADSSHMRRAIANDVYREQV